VERFLAARDEAAFAAILRRHGPMVLRVCRRVLPVEQDAEDAFQATFLVLAREARTLRQRSSLASWLYGVAHRVALDARGGAARRRKHEARAANHSPSPAPDEVTWKEVQEGLAAELARLPERWRAPLVLCYLEGLTRDEAARQLGWSKMTLRRRLDEARAALGRRLAGRGVAWPAALGAVLVSEAVAPAVVRAGLVGPTLKAAACVAAGQAVTAVSARVAALAEGAMNALFLRRLAVGLGVLLLAVVAGTAGLLGRVGLRASVPSVTLTGRAVQAEAPAEEAGRRAATQRKVLEGMTWMVSAVDAAGGTISVDDRPVFRAPNERVVIQTPKGATPAGLALRDLKVSPDAVVLIGGKPAQLRNLFPGMQVSLRWAADRLTLERLEATLPPTPPRYRLDAVDLAGNTVSATCDETRLKLDKIPVARGANIRIYAPGTSPPRLDSATLADLRAGMWVSLELTPGAGGELVVKAITAGR
jgi:RNA polymerase sigma factor (sigma-70 family)